MRISAGAIGDKVRLTVSDTGRGMSAAQLDRLFEPFNRLGAERDGIEGTGIGMTIVNALVTGMGGRVEIAAPPAGQPFRSHAARRRARHGQRAVGRR